jgi:hyperosmotically inducible periplasmic protein
VDTLSKLPGFSDDANLRARADKQQQNEPRQNLIREIRHQLVLLPYYSVFDNLAFRIEGDTVILEGQVVRPTLKSDAENVIKKIEGVGRVVNNIEVLPASPMDDKVRRAVYRTIFGEPGLSRYAESAVPSIHIIVKNGNVTLVGVMDSEADKDLVNMTDELASASGLRRQKIRNGPELSYFIVRPIRKNCSNEIAHTIQGGSRIRRSACTDLCAGRSAMIVPTASSRLLVHNS